MRSTTNPVRLGLWHGQGPVTIYATYASLPVLIEAFAGSYGTRLGPVDLLVVDEAHRTSGSMGKAWADVHDQSLVPAARRLYMTATPRIWEEWPNREVAEGRRDPLPEEQAASMADTAIFGPVLWKLSLASAITRGLLARYRIIVMEITDPVLTRERLYGEDRLTEEVRGQRMAALQAGLIRTMTEHDLQSVITFHHRTREANAFVAGLPRVVRRLHAHDPGRYPAKVWADWLCGDHDPGRRQEVLRQLRATALPAVLSNAKVLNEGVDAPSVDSVALLDPKGAPHDIVQAIGRALRQKPNQGKMASLVVPVFLQPGEPPNSRDYRPLTRVLRGLRAHDAEAVEMLAIPQADQKRLVDPSFPLGEGPEDENGEDERFLLRISTRQDPGFIADLVRFEVMDVERDDWQRGHSALRAFVGREGHAQVPYGHTEETGRFPLGRWISEQRRAFSAGEMKARRAEDLERLGMVWDVPDAAWQANLAAARAYYEEHATLAAPRGAVALGRPVGQFLANSRRPQTLARFPERAAALAAIDPDWNAPWPPTWQRHYAALRELISDEPEDAAAAVPPDGTIYGLDIGKWAANQTQRKTWDGLHEGQRQRLEDLGIRPAPATPGNAPVPAQRRLTAFDKGVAAMRAWREREGDTPPSRAHVEHVVIDGQDVAVKLGIWRSNARSRKAGLSEEQRAVLDELGV